MTDNPQNPDDPISNPLDPDGDDHIEDDDEDWVEAIFINRPARARTDHPADPYDSAGCSSAGHGRRGTGAGTTVFEHSFVHCADWRKSA